MTTPTFVDKNDPASYPLAIRDILIKNGPMLVRAANEVSPYRDAPLSYRTFVGVNHDLHECVFPVSELKVNASLYFGDQPVKDVIQQLCTLALLAGDQVVRVTKKSLGGDTITVSDIAPIKSPQARDMQARYFARRIESLADQIGFFARAGNEVAQGKGIEELPGQERHFEAYGDLFESTKKAAGSIEEEAGQVARPSWNLPAGELESEDELPSAPLLPADKPAVGIKPWVKK